MPTLISQRTALAAALAACFPGLALGAGVARVDFAIGNVSAIGADGRTRPLSRGSEIQVGETVATQQGRAQLRFADGAYMSLQPGTEFKVEEFRYSGKPDAGDNIVMNLIKGGMRTITGLIGRTNRANYKLRTDVATIGIRGTEYTVRYTNSIEVFCVDGQIYVQNEAGTLNLNGGQGAMVSTVQTPPQRNDAPPILAPQERVETQVPDPVNPVQESLPAAVPVVLTGTFTGNWAAAVGTSVHTTADQTVTLDSSGALVAFADSFEGPVSTTLGTATAQSSGNDGIIAWGRWVGGMTSGDGFASDRDLSTSALHYVVGLPTTPSLVPTTGVAKYEMFGSTSPTVVGLSTASLNSSSITVDFGNVSASFSADFTVNGGNVRTQDGGIPITLDGSLLYGSAGTSAIVSTGAYCTKSLDVSGFLAGDAATRAGMAYRLTLDGGSVTGAAAYQQSGPLQESPTPNL